MPTLRKSATVIPLSKKHPRVTIENEIRLTPIISTVFKSLVLKWVDVYVKPQTDDKQYGEMGLGQGTCTTDALVVIVHTWYESFVVVVVVKALFLDGNHVTWYIVIFNGPSSYMHTYIIYIHTIKL